MSRAAWIPAGTKGWFEVKFGTADVATFAETTLVEIRPYSEHWVATVGRVDGFPQGHPPILIPIEKVR